jgi:hypothetical protein
MLYALAGLLVLRRVEDVDGRKQWSDSQTSVKDGTDNAQVPEDFTLLRPA